MRKSLDQPSPDDEIIRRCFRRNYIFIPTETPVENDRLLGNQLQALIAGEVTEIRFMQFGHDKRKGYRITVETEVECPEDDLDLDQDDDGIKRSAGMWPPDDE